MFFLYNAYFVLHLRLNVRDCGVQILQTWVVILNWIGEKEEGEMKIRFGGWMTTGGDDRLAQALLYHGFSFKALEFKGEMTKFCCAKSSLLLQ